MNIEEAIKICKKAKKPIYHEVVGSEWIKGYTSMLGTDLDEVIETLLTAYEKEKEKNKDMSCDLTETRADNIDESTMLKQIKLKLQEKNIPIETLLAEFERLEDLEDDLTIVYLNGVYDGEKKVKDKIKAKIEETNNEELNYNEDEYWLEQEIKGYAIDKMQSLLEKE